MRNLGVKVLTTAVVIAVSQNAMFSSADAAMIGVSDDESITFESESKNYNKATLIGDNKKEIKEYPSSSAPTIALMTKGCYVDIILMGDKWTKVKNGDISGYVCTKDIAYGYELDSMLESDRDFKKVVTVKTDSVRIRDGNSKKNRILMVVDKGYETTLSKELDKWVKVVTDDGTEGYISKKYVKIKTVYADVEEVDLPEDDSSICVVSPGSISLKNAATKYTGEDISEKRKEIVGYALQFLGNPYVWGGTSLTNGADCSGFVQSVYRDCGIQISRTSRQQANNGKEIEADELRPGDLLFYIDNKTGKIGHVTMYIGDDKVIHASNKRDGIKISSLYYREPCKIVSILDD